MIALTFVSLLLLAVVGGQHLLAPQSSRRLAHRRLHAAGRTISVEAGAELERALIRRMRVACVGGALGILVSTTVLWIVVREPTGAPGLLPVAIALGTTVLGSVLAETVHIARSTPPVSDGPRVAGLRAREPHLTRRESVAETGFAAIAVVGLVLAASAWGIGVEHGAAATTCAAAAVVTIGATAAGRSWLLRQPTAADDSDRAVVAELVTTASADRATENLVANGIVLLMYAVIVIVPELPALAIPAGLALLLAATVTTTIATNERRRAHRGVTP